MAIEPLTEAVSTNPEIHGLTIADRQHKITLYADDVLIFLTNSDVSISTLIEVINKFSAFSGYRMNSSKSEAMPLGSLKQKPQTLFPFPFKWSPEGFAYLGIYITPTFDQMDKRSSAP